MTFRSTCLASFPRLDEGHLRALLRAADRRVPRLLFAVLRLVRLLRPSWARRIPIRQVRYVVLAAIDVAVRRVPKDFLATTVDGTSIRGNTRDLIQRWIYVFAVWEPDLTAVVRAHLRPGAVAVDIGANGGYYTALMASRVGVHGHVVAVESLPATARLLRLNVAANGPDRTVVHEVAAGAERGTTAMFSTDPGNSGRASTQGAGVPAAQVPVVPLDDLVPPELAARICLVKVDVEGDEVRVLRGARRTLDSLPAGAALLLEASPDLAADLRDLLPADRFDAFVVENPYSVWHYSTGRVLAPRPWDGRLEVQTDLLFVRR